MQASTDEYDGARTPMQLVDPIEDPRQCFDECDGTGSCYAVLVTKDTTSNIWICSRIDGDYNTAGVVNSAVKVQPTNINRYMWLE